MVVGATSPTSFNTVRMAGLLPMTLTGAARSFGESSWDKWWFSQADLMAASNSPLLNLKTAFEKAGQGCSALILLGDANPNRSHRISPAG